MAGATITNAFAAGPRIGKHPRTGFVDGGGRMHGRGWALVVSGLLSGVAVAAEPASVQPVTVIRAGTLIDGVSGSAKTNQVIVIRGNRIESVGTGAAPAGAKVIDLSGATVLPGLIDAHTHIFLQGEEPAEGGYDVQLLKYGIAFRAARATVAGAARARAGLHDHPRRRDRRRGLRRRRDQAGDRRGHIPGPRMFVVDARDLDDRRLQPRGLRAGGGRAEGRADRRRPGRGAQGGARAARDTAPTGSRCT